MHLRETSERFVFAFNSWCGCYLVCSHAAAGVEGTQGSAKAVAVAVAQRVRDLLSQLPPDFFHPLVAPDHLDEAQVQKYGF